MISPGRQSNSVKPISKDQHFSHWQECDRGVKFIETLQYADSLQLGCVSDQVYDESVDVPEVLVTNLFIYNQPRLKKK